MVKKVFYLWVSLFICFLVCSGLSWADDVFEITMQNKDSTTNLYTDISNEVYLKIKNISGKSISIPAKKKSSSDDYCISVDFDRGILSNDKNKPILLDTAGWDSTISWDDPNVYMSSFQDVIWEENKTLMLSLSNILINEDEPSDLPVNISVPYQKLYYDDGAEIKSSLLPPSVQMTVAKSEGITHMPLHVGLVNVHSVLNNDTNNTPLTLRVTNVPTVSGEEVITFASGDNGSSIEIYFDVQQDGQTMDWALTSHGQDGISIECDDIKDDNNEVDGPWIINKSTQGPIPIWTITPQNDVDVTLASGEYRDFTVKNILTTLPAGITNLYLKTINIDGYKDTVFRCPIEKTPLVIRQRDVNSAFIGPDSSGGFSISFDRDTEEYPGVVEEDGVESPLIKLSTSVIDTGKGVMTGAAHDYAKAQDYMSGGGKITWKEGENKDEFWLHWDQRFITPVLNKELCSSRHIEINFLDKNIPEDNVYDGKERKLNDKMYILLKKWEILYAVHTVSEGKDAINFYIEILTKDNPNKPTASNWLMIAFVNGDDNTVKLGTGTILSLNSSTKKGNVLPSGTVVAWSGSKDEIPDGWVLCDGKNTTPDLTQRFIVGAGGSDNQSYSVGDVGGNRNVTLTEDQLPAHTHGNAGSHSHSRVKHDGYDVRWGDGSGDGKYYIDSTDEQEKKDDKSGYLCTNDAGDHEHSSVGKGDAHENRPPYYALCYIMKQ